MNFAALLAPAPSGVDLPTTEAFVDLRAYVARLDLPEGEPVDWLHVERVARALLTTQGKDLLLASYAGFAPVALGVEHAPQRAIVFLQTFIDNFWETMTPPKDRPRARANCIAWFLNRLRQTLPDMLAAQPQAQRDAVREALVALAQSLRARLGDAAPNTSTLVRLLDGARKAPAALRAVQRPGALPTGPAQHAPLSKPDAHDCIALGRALCLLAQARQRTNAFDAQACRLWRVGLWLNVHQKPALSAQGRTNIAPLGHALQAQLVGLRETKQWEALYRLAEQSMLGCPLCLDLQYCAALAAKHLQAPRNALAQIILQETQALCRRIPGLAQMRAADGSLLAAAETTQWLAADVVAPGTQPAAPNGQTATKALSTASQRSFHKRLAEAQSRLASGDYERAEALFDLLVRSVLRHRLDLWEAALAQQVLEGHLRALKLQSPCDTARLRSAYRRLMRLCPTSALCAPRDAS